MKKQPIKTSDHECNIRGCKSFSQHLMWIKKTPPEVIKLIQEATMFKN